MVTLATLVEAGEGGLVVPCLVPTFVRAIGRGDPVVVVGGGPGLDHTYLLEPLQRLARRRTLVFYDQPGCGRSGTGREPPSADLACMHFAALTDLLFPDGCAYGILTHSWGSFVAIGAQGAPGRPRFREGLLVNPVALTRVEWDRAAAGLIAGMPPAAVQGFFETLQSGAGPVSLAPLLPFYCTRPVVGRHGELRVEPRTYLSILASLADFDLREHASRCLSRVDVLVGSGDFTGTALLDGLIDAARAVHTVETGHFPFWEDPPAFAQAVDTVFR